ncbi:MAG: AAA family ATPase [Elusimicrobia bacterium]|nr:AAA family ATPase [Elusimicrobiota bacterium]
MKKQDAFKTNQQYLSAFFTLAGAQRRNAWDEPGETPAAPKKGTKPAKPPAKEEVIRDFRIKVKRTLIAGVILPLEALAKQHNLTFQEKAVLAYFAGTELYRAHIELGGMINRFETKGIAPAFETVKLIGPGSTLIKKKLISINQREFPSRYCPDEASLPAKIFSLITGLPVKKEPKPKAQPRVKTASAPAAIYEKLAEYVVGQEEAKKAISAGVFLHLKRTQLNKHRPKGQKIAKSNILIIGPTGCGKTHICRTLAGALNLPFHITDATQYTETGYVGRGVEEMLLDLHKDKNLSPSAHGIIYIDEIDKIAAQNPGGGHYGDRDVSGKSVQEELLKMLEGGAITCEKQRGHEEGKVIDASNVLFIAGGAFQGLEEIIAARLKKKSIGFRGSSGESAPGADCLLKQVQPEDLIAYGFMPEFVGRFPVIAVLDRLTKEDLVNIITGTKNSLLSQYRAIIAETGLDMQIPEDMPERVAEAALKRDLGARAIKGIMEKWLTEELFRRQGARPAQETPPSQEPPRKAGC